MKNYKKTYTDVLHKGVHNYVVSGAAKTKSALSYSPDLPTTKKKKQKKKEQTNTKNKHKKKKPPIAILANPKCVCIPGVLPFLVN